ncbi:metallophosphoesterase family protein [Micromonospora sp. NPDC003197]
MTDDQAPPAPPVDIAPARPRSCDPQELGFAPQAPVPWLAPLLLISTGLRALLALLFGAYLDKRELQNSLPSDGHREPGDADGLWLDYVADLGDGFDATYSVAYLLAQREIEVEGQRLPRGDVLVMGGDQVYPTASGQAYEDRCKGPYQAALPQVGPGEQSPNLYAVPGNHDWYDGLTAFLRLFARSRDNDLGGWCTPQHRSYFSIELPANWWLFGLDEQSGAYLDDPQLRYFEQAATALGPESRVILVVPAPSWVKAVDNPGAYDAVDYFVRKIIGPTGAQVRLLLSGDLHHYARYTGPDRELITCGGGGAYLYPTHKLPERIEVPPRDSLTRRPSRTEPYRLAARYPDAARSRRYGWGVFGRLPLRNPGFLTLLGLLHTLLMLAMAGVAVQHTGTSDRGLFSVPMVGMLAIFLLGAGLFAKPPSAGGKRHVRHWILGLSHGIAQIMLAALGTWLWLMLPFHDWSGAFPVITAGVLYGPVAGLVAGQLTAAYLLVAGSFGVNLNELFAGQGIEDAKSFLRLHFSPTGELTIYPIAIDRISHSWRADPDGAPDTSWVSPTEPLPARFAEPPLTIR